jgi:transposase-like protein
MTRKRKHFTAQQKVAILRLHLLEKQPVSDICDEHDIHPNLFYRWQQQFFENGAAAFEQSRRGRKDAHQRKLEALEDKLQRRNAVLAELMEEHVLLKKELGEL